MLVRNTERSGDPLNALSQPNHPSFPSGHQLITMYKSQLYLVDPLNRGPWMRSNSPRLPRELLAKLGLTSCSSVPCILPVC